jgi:uncharacterized protein (TIGR02231 family)
MKKILVITFVATNLFSFAQKKEVIADSKISEVTVFLNNAQITREAKINLAAGTNLISFEKLSQQIIPGSIQVEGSDSYTIVSVNSSVNYLQEGFERPDVKAMKKELNRVQDEIKLNQTYLNVYNEQQNLLIANHIFKGENKGITVEDMLSMMEIYKVKLSELQDKMYDCEIKAKRMNIEYGRIQNQINELVTKFNRYTTTVSVNLSASKNTTSNVKITYLVNNASWVANYDAKAKNVDSPLELVLKATVTQTTGEDWNNVKLKLSTGNPNKNKTKPDLAMWSLYAYDEVVYKSNRKGKGNAAMKTETVYDEKKAENSEYDKIQLDAVEITNQSSSTMISTPGVKNNAYTTNTSYNYTTIIETGVNAEYDIDIPYTILSDGKENTVEIKKYDIPASYAYYAIPKLDKDAFLVASITGWEKYNFIPGYVNVYINDTYTGRSYFDSQSVEDTLDLSMGRDNSVIITRKKTKDFSGNAIIGGSRKSNMGFEISIRNSRKTAIKLNIYDQFPLSTQKEIEITTGETSGAKHNKETGKLDWEMEVPAGESKVLKFNYSVKYPKDKTITNLGG